MLSLRSPLLGVALLAAPLCAQGSIMPYLPKDTAMAVSVPDLSASIQRFSSMPLAKMWAEEDTQKFVADAMAMARQQIDQAMEQAKQMHAAGNMPVDPELLKELRLNGGTFAITHLEMVNGDMGPMPKVGMVLYLDFGASAQQWFGLLQMGLGMLEMQAGQHMEKSEAVVGDCKLTTLSPVGAPPGMEMGLNIAMTKTGLLVGSLTSDVRSILENLQKGTPVLTATDAYKANQQQLGAKNAETEMFMRMEPFVGFGMNVLAMAAEHERGMQGIDVEGIGRAIDALGLNGIKSVGVVSSYVDGKGISKSYMRVPAPERKGFFAGSMHSLDTGFFKWVPKDAVSFSGSTFEPMSIYNALVGALQAYDPEMAEMVLGQLDQVEQQLGFTIKDDLFGSLGDTFLSWQMPMGAITSIPEMALLLKVKDQDKVVKVLKSIAAMTDGMFEIKESEKRGIKAFSIHMNLDMNGGPAAGIGNFIGTISPTFAFKDGWLVLGFSSSDIKRAFARMDREDDPKNDIRGNKEFAAQAAMLPKEVQSVSFTDWKASFEAIYQNAAFLLMLVPANDDIPLDTTQLPEASVLTQHLFGSLSYSQADANGFATTTVSPFGPEVALALAGLLAAGIGVAGSMRGFR